MASSSTCQDGEIVDDDLYILAQFQADMGLSSQSESSQSAPPVESSASPPTKVKAESKEDDDPSPLVVSVREEIQDGDDIRTIEPDESNDQQDLDQANVDDDAVSVSSELSEGFYETLQKDVQVDLNYLSYIESKAVSHPITASSTPITNAAPSAASTLEKPLDGQQLDGFSPSDLHNLRHTLRRWTKQSKASRAVNHLYYRLDNKYLENHYPASPLLTRDLALTNALVGLASRIPFEVFLAVLDREDGTSKISPDGYLVKRLMDIGGRVLAEEFPVEERNMLKPRRVNLQEQPHHEMALVLVPRDSVATFLFESADVLRPHRPHSHSAKQCPNIAEYYALLQSLDPESGQRQLPVFEEVCNKVWESDAANGVSSMPDAVLETIVKATIKTKDWELFNQAASHSGGKLPTSFFKWARAEVNADHLALKDIGQGIMSAILSFPNIHDRYTALTSFFDAVLDIKARPWAQQTIAKILGPAPSQTSLGEKDGQALVKTLRVVLGFSSLTTDYSPSLSQVVDKNASRLPFMFGVIFELRMGLIGPQTPAVRRLIESLVKQTIESLQIAKFLSRDTLKRQGSPSTNGKSEKNLRSSLAEPPRIKTPDAVDLDYLVRLFDYIFTERISDNLLLQLILKITEDAQLILSSEFIPLWVPFLQKLIGVLEREEITLSQPRYKHMFAAILEAFQLKYAGTKPIKEPVFITRRLQCACRVCQHVNKFLGDTTASSIKIMVYSFETRHFMRRSLYFLEHIGCKCIFGNGCMVVRKEQKLTENADGEWRGKKWEVMVQFRRIGLEKLYEILGDEILRIVDLGVLRESAIPVSLDGEDESSNEPNLDADETISLPQHTPPNPVEPTKQRTLHGWMNAVPKEPSNQPRPVRPSAPSAAPYSSPYPALPPPQHQNHQHPIHQHEGIQNHIHQPQIQQPQVHNHQIHQHQSHHPLQGGPAHPANFGLNQAPQPCASALTTPNSMPSLRPDHQGYGTPETPTANQQWPERSPHNANVGSQYSAPVGYRAPPPPQPGQPAVNTVAHHPISTTRSHYPPSVGYQPPPGPSQQSQQNANAGYHQPITSQAQAHSFTPSFSLRDTPSLSQRFDSFVSAPPKPPLVVEPSLWPAGRAPDGFKEFADELGRCLRQRDIHVSNATINRVVKSRWNSLLEKHRAIYATVAAMAEPSRPDPNGPLRAQPKPDPKASPKPQPKPHPQPQPSAGTAVRRTKGTATVSTTGQTAPLSAANTEHRDKRRRSSTPPGEIIRGIWTPRPKIQIGNGCLDGRRVVSKLPDTPLAATETATSTGRGWSGVTGATSVKTAQMLAAEQLSSPLPLQSILERLPKRVAAATTTSPRVTMGNGVTPAYEAPAYEAPALHRSAVAAAAAAFPPRGAKRKAAVVVDLTLDSE
ncbi:hypothetical protein B0T17DRAFT_522522 [Bombardia bombarda]|uniref:Uncharacterized protein n=1 Tax=Bombardia bombarda TaxID=252184 RepID=A0AA40C8Q7_9PEZI|nr:hypothetical protein B0T17DRAFT_522522 [Bombardia bombarda]